MWWSERETGREAGTQRVRDTRGRDGGSQRRTGSRSGGGVANRRGRGTGRQGETDGVRGGGKTERQGERDRDQRGEKDGEIGGERREGVGVRERRQGPEGGGRVGGRGVAGGKKDERRQEGKRDENKVRRGRRGPDPHPVPTLSTRVVRRPGCLGQRDPYPCPYLLSPPPRAGKTPKAHPTLLAKTTLTELVAPRQPKLKSRVLFNPLLPLPFSPCVSWSHGSVRSQAPSLQDRRRARSGRRRNSEAQK